MHQDLVDLMRIPSLNGQRARALFAAGFQSLNAISTADVLAIEKCLHDAVSFDCKQRDGESNYEAEQRNKNRMLFLTGRAGLTIAEAARIIIEEAREYLQNEMGSVNIVWSRKGEAADVERDRETETSPRDPPEDAKELNANVAQIDSSIQNENAAEPSEESPIEVSQRVTRRQSASVDSISMNSSRDMNQSMLLNASHILSDSKTEPQSSDMSRIKIIDVFQNREFYEIFKSKIDEYPSGGFAVATAKRNDVVAARNCVITDDLYVHGIAVCFDENISFYLNLQDQGENSVRFSEKINFLKTMLGRSAFILHIADAKEQLKLLCNAIPEIDRIDCSLSDPKIAHWLLQSESEVEIESYSLHRIAHIYSPECTALAESISTNGSETTPRQR